MSVGEGVGNGEGLQKGPITNTIAPYEPPLPTHTDSHALQPLCCLWSSFRLMLIMNPTPEPLGIRREPMGSHTLGCKQPIAYERYLPRHMGTHTK